MKESVSKNCIFQVDAGMDKDIVYGDPKAPRFVWWDRKLRPTPSGPDALTFDLLSIGGKLRAGLGALGIKKAAPGSFPLLCYSIPSCFIRQSNLTFAYLFDMR